MRRTFAAARVLMLVAAAAVLPAVAPAQAPAPKPAARAARADVDRLPVSLVRIRRQLARQTSSQERFENFRLLTSLDVYGNSPGLEFFTAIEDESFESLPGAVRYGGVTHSEFLSQVQPKNLPYGNARPPVANLSGNLLSLANWASDKRKEAQKRKEQEARKRRALEAQQDPKR